MPEEQSEQRVHNCERAGVQSAELRVLQSEAGFDRIRQNAGDLARQMQAAIHPTQAEEQDDAPDANQRLDFSDAFVESDATFVLSYPTATMSGIEEAVNSFYEAALSPERWPAALDSLAAAFDSGGVTLVRRSTKLGSIAVSGTIAPIIPDYFASPIEDPRELLRPSTQEGFLPDQAHFSPREISRNPYYQEFLRPRGFGWNAVAALGDDLHISIKRGFSQPAYDGMELQELNRALPWLRAASRAALSTWQAGFAGQLSATEKLGRAALLINRDARVLSVNGCMTFGDGLDVSRGVLQATYPAVRQKVQTYLAALVAGTSASSAPPPAIAVARPSGKRPWLLSGIPCGEAARGLHSDVAALVMITSTDTPRAPSVETLAETFGLTPTEANLARQLATGASLQEAAATLRISQGHARQRLQGIFYKTNTARQGELVALLARFG